MEGNLYARHRTQLSKSGITIRWRCIHVFKTKCKSVIYTTLQEGSEVKLLYEHNHTNNADLWDRNNMIPKTFRMIHSKRECKPGVESTKKRLHKPVTKKKKWKQQTTDIKIPVEGSFEPILIKVLHEEEDGDFERSPT